MSYNNDTIKALEYSKQIASAATILPGPAGIVAGVIGEAINIALAAAQAGKDPLEHLKRLRREDELLSRARKHILDELKRKLHTNDSDS